MTDISKLIGQLWREASAETKAHFAELAAASKVRWFDFFSHAAADFFKGKKT